MDDGWELTNFGDLRRDGTGDADGDGASDMAEFPAGANPNDPTSVFAGTLVVRTDTGAVTLHWPSIPGKSYSVQSRETLESLPWIDVVPRIVATSAETSFTETPAGATRHRFYRVILLP